MQADKSRDHVIILNVATAHFPLEHPVEAVMEGVTVWAEIKGISGREIVSNRIEAVQVTARAWMGFRHDMTATLRLKVLVGAFKRVILDIEGPPVLDTRVTRLEILYSLKRNV